MAQFRFSYMYEIASLFNCISNWSHTMSCWHPSHLWAWVRNQKWIGINLCWNCIFILAHWVWKIYFQHWEFLYIHPYCTLLHSRFQLHLHLLQEMGAKTSHLSTHHTKAAKKLALWLLLQNTFFLCNYFCTLAEALQLLHQLFAGNDLCLPMWLKFEV